MKKFAEKLKSLREEKGLSQVELSAVFGVDKSTIAKYETGGREPDLETLVKFAKYFKVSTDYLLGLED